MLLDLLTAKFLAGYSTKPLYIFGGVGLSLGFLAFVSLAIAIIQKVTIGVSLIQTPLTMLAAILGATGFIAILQGTECGGLHPYLSRVAAEAHLHRAARPQRRQLSTEPLR